MHIYISLAGSVQASNSLQTQRSCEGRTTGFCTSGSFVQGTFMAKEVLDAYGLQKYGVEACNTQF